MNRFTVTILDAYGEPHGNYGHYTAQASHRSPKIAMRLANENLSNQMKNDPCQIASLCPILKTIKIHKGNKLVSEDIS